MRKIHIPILTCFALLCKNGKAQVPISTSELISTSGTYFEAPSGHSLSWSIGEPLTATYDQGSILTQGFHQPSFGFVGLTVEEIEFAVYPNPVNEYLTIQSSLSEAVNIEIRNALGQHIINEVIHAGINQIDLSQIASGVYFICVLNKKKSTIKFEKL